MSGRIERTLDELYYADPERADAVAFGRVSPLAAGSLAAAESIMGLHLQSRWRACGDPGSAQTNHCSSGDAIDWTAMQAFVTNTYANTVSVVDLLTSKVTGTFPTGRGPNGIAFH